MSAFQLLHPERWPLLLLPPAVWLALLAARRLRAADRRAFADAPAWAALAPPPPRGRRLRAAALAAGLVLAACALLEPSWGIRLLPVRFRGADLVVCFDVSRSMQAQDLRPSRDQRARRDLEALLDALEGDRIALVAFAGDARVVCPLTHDYAAFKALLERTDATSTRLGGTDLGAALRAALACLPADATARSQAILVLTDGEDLAGKGLAEAARARRRGITVHAVGYGTPGGAFVPDGKGGYLEDEKGERVLSRLDAEGLRRLAESCGGVYVPADGLPLPLVEIYRKRIRALAKRLYEAEERRRPVPRAGWFLWPAFVLLLAGLGLGGARLRAAALCLPLALPPGGDPFARGVALLRRGAAPAAYKELKRALEGYPRGRAPAALLADLALAAARSGRPVEAETYAERAAARDPGLAFLRDLVHGTAAYERARAALADPRKAGGADPARDVERAVAAFERAVLRRPEAAYARRNLARALALERLLRETAKKHRQPKGAPKDSQQGTPGKQPQGEKDRGRNEKKSAPKAGKKKERGPSAGARKPGDRSQKAAPPPEENRARRAPEPSAQHSASKKDRGRRAPGKGRRQPAQPKVGKGGSREAAAPKAFALSPEEAKRLRARLQRLLDLAKERRRLRAARHRPGRKDW